MADSVTDMPIIDCDAHFTEPPDLWLSRVAPSWRKRMPVQKTIDGTTWWFVDDEIWATIGGNTIRVGAEKVLGLQMVQPFEAIDPSAWSVKERLHILDSMGVATQVIYPNAVGFSSNHMFALEDVEQRMIVLQTYNDFFMDIQEESGGRLLPQPLLPVWDMDLTLKEMARLIDRGARGFTLSDRPELLGLPELDSGYFAPMWDLFNESGSIASFHVASGMRREEQEAVRRDQVLDAKPGTTMTTVWSSFGPQRRLATHCSQVFISNLRIITNLLMSDLFDRYPNLKIVSAESGIGWIPFVLEACEYQLDEMVTDAEELSRQKRRPTEYFRDHIWTMFWFERVGPARLIGDIGVKNVLVETDIPHPTCLYPDTRERLIKAVGELTLQDQRRVLYANAAELYSIDLEKIGAT